MSKEGKKKYNSFFEEVKFVLQAHVFNPIWEPRIKRRRRRGKYTYAKVERYLSRYKGYVENLSIAEPASLINEEKEEKIFSIWFQGEESAPPLVKICFRRLKDVYGERFMVLDSKSIWDWITLPEYIKNKWESGLITPAHFSDICRVALLYQNGGMWFDATDFLTSKVPQWIEDSDLFIYLEGDRITPGTLVQSCFMRARKGHPLFKAWLDFIYHYWENEERLIHYFLLHYLLRYMVDHNPAVKNLFLSMPQVKQDPTHILWHEHRNLPYSEELYREDTKDTFFQKTSFKRKQSREIQKGSVAEKILSGEISSPVITDAPKVSDSPVIT